MVLLIMRRLRPGIAVLLFLALAAAVSVRADQPGATLTRAEVYARDGWLHADLHLRDLIDHRTRSTIDSGLSGICAYEVTLLDGGSRVAGQRWVLHLEHDLWEDRYLVRGPDGDRELASLAAMDSVVSFLEGVRLAPLGRLDQQREYRLRVTVEVQPLAAEDQDRLASYISRRGDRSREELDLDLGSLFGRLFSGGSGGATALDATGGGFRIGGLERRP